MADRRTKERKLVALVVNDLETANLSEPEMTQMEEEVRSLPDEELDRTLALRLDLPHPVNEEVMDQFLARVEEPERLTQEGLGGFTGAPDMSHEPRTQDRNSPLLQARSLPRKLDFDTWGLRRLLIYSKRSRATSKAYSLVRVLNRGSLSLYGSGTQDARCVSGSASCPL